ncbi:uncharacterized protein LOC126814699 [Patella vulgata]|uniref:uncharacterized protein LOC126814699 n=1 Tax=Patella vulgata TaxID=6465 RepID=UPI0024A7F523|nr:uncharacterized protein LOC126814699 [Patella vulgata]
MHYTIRVPMVKCLFCLKYWISETHLFPVKITRSMLIEIDKYFVFSMSQILDDIDYFKFNYLPNLIPLHFIFSFYDDIQYLENFRMSKCTFEYLCRILRPFLEKQVTSMREPISVERQVGISLWVLGTNAEYRTVAALFGVGRSTVSSIIHIFCESLISIKDKFIKFPSGEELNRVVNGYRSKWGFPNAGGAIDGSHIPILGPSMNHADFHNRKGWYSIIVQAVVNDRYEFTDLNIGWPGSVHDARVYANSKIYAKGLSGTLFAGKMIDVNNVRLPIVLLGDPAYPLSNFLMEPYTDNGHLTPKQKTFNYKLSSSRMTVENSFGRLKGRWRCLLKRLDMNVDKVPNIIMTCCILHNICEQAKYPFRVEWLEDVAKEENQMSQPNQSNEEAINADCTNIRNILAEYFQE